MYIKPFPEFNECKHNLGVITTKTANLTHILSVPINTCRNITGNTSTAFIGIGLKELVDKHYSYKQPNSAYTITNLAKNTAASGFEHWCDGIDTGIILLEYADISSAGTVMGGLENDRRHGY